jgi:hypothetical protein
MEQESKVLENFGFQIADFDLPNAKRDAVANFGLSSASGSVLPAPSSMLRAPRPYPWPYCSSLFDKYVKLIIRL